MASYKPMTRAQIEEKAKKLGKVVVYPNRYQLFVDIDSDTDHMRFNDLVAILEQSERITHFAFPSKTPGHCHIIVTLDREISPWERVALQAAMGSDRKRELLAILNARHGDPGTNCFFMDPI